MVSSIRRNGDDGKTFVLVYGDSITDGFGASDMKQLGYGTLIKNGLQALHPTLDTVRNSAGYRCVIKDCIRPCHKDGQCQDALKMNVSAVTLFMGTNDCKN